MFYCSKCNKEFFNKASKSNHEKWCDGNGTRKEQKKKPFICPICNFEIKSSRELHMKSCDGYGPRRLRNPNRPKGPGRGWSKGIRLSDEHKNKIGESNIGNPGIARDPDKEEERKRRISETMKKNPNAGGYRKRSGRGHKGWYKGYWCDSSWELAWVIYHLDHGANFERNWEKFEYVYEGVNRQYIPDFKIGEDYIEIKGYNTKQFEAKRKSFPLNLIVFKKDEMIPILDYVKEKYGENFLYLYE